MNARLQQPPPVSRQDTGLSRSQALEEHDTVTLTEAVSDGGTLIPAGTVGTIVSVWVPEEAFEVEFTDPEAIVTLQRNQVRLHQRLAC